MGALTDGGRVSQRVSISFSGETIRLICEWGRVCKRAGDRIMLVNGLFKLGLG